MITLLMPHEGQETPALGFVLELFLKDLGRASPGLLVLCSPGVLRSREG